MAHQLHLDNHKNNHRTSTLPMPTNNQVFTERYDQELMQLIERERQLHATQQQPSLYHNQYRPSTHHVQTSIQQAQPNQQVNRQMSAQALLPQLPLVKPLRIIIIRHAERADAALGSDWSKKSFDRSGRYIRFSEHLPEALPNRSYLHHYVIDVPLTNRGCFHAFKTGKALLTSGYAVDICYTSPSLRCVQSADGILNGMGRKGVPMKLEPGLFECYLNDFKRTLCFMTKDELASNGYNIDKSYPALMPFMRPHDSQLDYYERCRSLMNIITERHQGTGGTILIVAHAPSLEGLTRHLSGGKFQPEKLFDIARRVPFLAMTIVEKNGPDRSWLFRTQPLQTTGMPESPFEIKQTPVPTPTIDHNPSKAQAQRHPHVSHRQQAPQIQTAAANNHAKLIQQQQRMQQVENLRSRPLVIPTYNDPRKVVKSSTAPNLPTSNSLSEMFRVI